ncbi:methionine--tRNA ligase [Candidatus Micrarchaeota archaeon CG10_big_fil_rev_8_21_14_0_10_45_29]|nr:MAG: methionine--tRNA ligase [Candidatus Micrarchaeota archaeon CG10_big_fil_rev_8_21_14_0_10_45_29]
MKKILITSALPYVNNVPHLGNIIGCVLSADVFARYCRLKGYETLYVCGTDEYGTATEAKAIEEKCTPKEICDKYSQIHREIYEWFNISTDVFGRTSTKLHSALVQKIFLQLYENNMLIEKEVEQPYDEKLGMFLADRYISGICPYCASEDARADQCDKCGKLLTYSELKSPKSKLSGAKPILRISRHLFLNLQKSQAPLEKWIKEIEKEGRWSANTIAIANSWLKEGLHARSITRDLKWGVPVPLKGWEKKVLYVWFDAPIGYMSITQSMVSDYMKWWGGDENVHHYEFIGKDNVPFHAITFPATLLGTGKKYTLPHYISSTEFLNYESGKFSKSRGVGVFGNDAKNSGIPADAWRYYLISNRPETADTIFSWDDFGKKINNELLANFANLANRTLVFLQNNFEGVVPSVQFTQEDREFADAQRVKIAKIDSLLSQVKLRAAIAEFMSASAAANAYFQANEPWKKIKEDKQRAGTVLNMLINQICDLAIVCQPFMPSFSQALFSQLNISPKKWDEAGKLTIKEGHKTGKPAHLLSPIEKKTLDAFKKQFAGKQKEMEKNKKNNPSTSKQKGGEKEKVSPLALEDLQLEVGLIEDVKKHPDAQKLYIEKVLLSGGEIRQVCSGLVPYLEENELLAKTCIIVKNLKFAKLRGVESQGMVLAAQSGEELELVSPDAVAGAKIEFEGISAPEKPREISIDEFFTISLEAKNGILYANGKKLLISGKPVKLSKLKNAKIS